MRQGGLSHKQWLMERVTLRNKTRKGFTPPGHTVTGTLCAKSQAHGEVNPSVSQIQKETLISFM